MPENLSPAVAPSWTPTHPLADLAAKSDPIGSGAPGVVLTPLAPGRMTLLVARADAQVAAAASLAASLGLAPPEPGEVSRDADRRLVWTGPGQWLLVAESAAPLAPLDEALVSVSDQTGARVLVRVSGPRAADALAKGLLVDLHPRAFGPAAAATTTMAHLGVLVWREADGFVLAGGRSTAADLWRFLVASAAGLGLAVERG
ncbi:sarcosine oxidase subunit gamma [Salinarimonas sp.]|uniref:sarcosine oxidase subunit gamma n=1 Tax=Salinarimonas sp. TaxID=2766526 RepID=UPI0032D8CBFA